MYIEKLSEKPNLFEYTQLQNKFFMRVDKNEKCDTERF